MRHTALKSILLPGGLLVVWNSLAIVLHSGGFKGGRAGSGPPLGDGPTPSQYSW